MTIQLRIVSLGAGVQSTTMVLMAAHGEITPMPDCAIFADTQSEPKAVYQHLDWLETQLPFPVYRVTVGSLRDHIIGATEGKNRMDARPPFYTRSGGMLRRQCTHDFKITPIRRKVRELLGLKRGQRAPKTLAVSQWLGISTDEAARMKPSQDAYVRHEWPLIAKDMSRGHCLVKLANEGLPRPPKSACTFCPYHSDAMWRDMKENDPESFADAVTVDTAIRNAVPGQRNSEEWFVHRSRTPLAEVDFDCSDDRQTSLFDDECSGVCGV